MKKITTILMAMLIGSAPAAAEDWSGWFVGVDAGYVYQSASNGPGAAIAGEGMVASASAGCWCTNIDDILLGADVSLGLGGATRRFGTIIQSSNVDLLAMGARLKAGIRVGDLIPYVAAGPQIVISEYTLTMGGSSTVSTQSEAGGTASFGLEALLGTSVASKIEFGSNFLLPRANANTSFSGWHTKIGLNYYF